MTKEIKFIYLLSVIWTFFLWSHLVVLLLSTNWHLQVDTDTCRLILTLTGWYWHLQVDTNTYRLILTLIGWYWHLQVDIDTYWLILTLTGQYDIKHIMMLQIKTITPVLKVSTYIITGHASSYWIHCDYSDNVCLDP